MTEHSNSKTENEIPFTAPEIEGLEFNSVIASGNHSSVFKATQILLERSVAVKLFRAAMTTQQTLRFSKEAKIAIGLEHSNIVKTLGHGFTADEHHAYILMEFVDGHSLREEIAKDAPLKFGRFREIFIPLLNALEYLHAQGILHHDIKPENILIEQGADSKSIAKLSDFGISKELRSEMNTSALTNTSAFAGTPAYMSPERFSNAKVSFSSDIYSISCIMYEALCAEPLHKGDTLYEILNQHQTSTLPSAKQLSRRMEIPPNLAKTILWGLEKLPDKRPQSAKEFSAELAKVLDEVTLDRAPLNRTAPGKRVLLKHYLLPSLVAGLAISLVVASILGQKQAQMKTTTNFEKQISNPSKKEMTLEELRQESLRLSKQGKFKEALNLELLALKNTSLSSSLFIQHSLKAAGFANEAVRMSTNTEERTSLTRTCIEICDSGMQLSIKRNDYEAFEDFCAEKGKAYAQTGNKEGLISLAKKSCRIAEKFSAPEQIELKLRLVEFMLGSKMNVQAESILSDILKTIKGNEELEHHVNGYLESALLLRSSTLLLQNRNQEALQQARTAAKAMLKDPLVKSSSRASLLGGLLGIIPAREFQSLAYTDLEQNSGVYLDNKSDTARVYQIIANSLEREGRLSESKQVLKKALAVLKEDKTTDFRVSMLGELINLSTKLNQPDDVQKYKNELEEFKRLHPS